MSQIQKMYPQVSELNSVQNNIKCSVEGCNKIFAAESNMSMHLVKHHKKQELERLNDNVKQFYCPEPTCVYNNERHFKKIKYLKQHYLKVHADKCYVCTSCKAGFPTPAQLNNHRGLCGVNFTCLDCTYSYTSYEALKTHSRRKLHKIADKLAFVKTKVVNIHNSEMQSASNTYVFPKQNSAMQTINIYMQVKSENNRVDKGIQTEKSNEKLKGKPSKRRSTQHTQTCSRKKSRISAETQTIGDCLLKKALQHEKINMKNKSGKKKSMETQTKMFDGKSKMVANWGELQNDQLEMNLLEKKTDDFNLNFLETDNIMHSSCQTNTDFNYFDTFGNCNSETQTEDFIYNDQFLQSSVFTSHIETQTNDEIDLDLYSNMYTQTCDSSLLSDLEFSNNQTQTAWPEYDMFVSTETQTLMTQNMKSILEMDINERETNHMETQTEFKQLLEEINA